MFFRKKRVRRDPYLSIYEAQQPIRLDEARLEAWAMSVGQRRDAFQPERKPHRGTLPDIDFSRAVAAERRSGVIARLFRRIFARERGEETDAEAVGETEGPRPALGETPRKPYVWLIEADGSERDDRKSSEPVVKYNGSRAA